ncbi:MAG: glycosyltransferase [Planctomycetes bacterium]|nr:glycosyltransferase [Planctomycetota bacterium]
MTQSLSVTVVMPAFDERHLVAEAVRRVLALEDARIARLELVAVDDGSRDGTRDILRRLAAEHPARMRLVEHPENRGKGAAVASGIELATGDVTIVQDADLEYDPRDIPRLLEPFLSGEADAVFGSRFLAGEYRRVLYFRHTLANKVLTACANVLTDLNLSDLETCYKAVRTSLLRSIPIRSRDFRVEVELVFKLEKRGARIFEVPIRYAGRTYEEGKKIRAKDGLLALGAMLHWFLVDDLYKPDEHGSNILVSMSDVPKFNRWMGDAIRPHCGDRVLEIGAGIGNMTRNLCPRESYTASDVNPLYLEYLSGAFAGRPYLDVRRCDLADPRDFEALEGRYDTVVCLNVLEHVPDEAGALGNVRRALASGGRCVVLVPQGPGLYGSLDEVLGHVRRYTRESLSQALADAGFDLETVFDFNRATAPAWWWNGRVLRRRHFGRVQLKALNSMVWLIRRLDPLLPWRGTSLVAVARRR